MQDLLNRLRRAVRKKARISILCVGSDLRGDDAAGLLVGRSLELFVKKHRLARYVQVVLGQTAPENFTGLIRKFKPGHIILVDSADVGTHTGQVSIIDPLAIAGISFCTHRLPLAVMVDYLRRGMRSEVTVIGIKPGRVSFSAPVCRQVRKSAQAVAAILKQLLKEKR